MAFVRQTPELPEDQIDRGPRTRHNEWQTLKSHPSEFQRVIAREKRGELRSIADRVFRVGERVNLAEWDPQAEEFTGDACVIRITSIDIGPDFGIPEDHALLSIELAAWLHDPPDDARDYLLRQCPVCLDEHGEYVDRTEPCPTCGRFDGPEEASG